MSKGATQFPEFHFSKSYLRPVHVIDVALPRHEQRRRPRSHRAQADRPPPAGGLLKLADHQGQVHHVVGHEPLKRGKNQDRSEAHTVKEVLLLLLLLLFLLLLLLSFATFYSVGLGHSIGKLMEPKAHKNAPCFFKRCIFKNSLFMRNLLSFSTSSALL